MVDSKQLSETMCHFHYMKKQQEASAFRCRMKLLSALHAKVKMLKMQIYYPVKKSSVFTYLLVQLLQYSMYTM